MRGRTKAMVLEKITIVRTEASLGEVLVDPKRTTADFLRWWMTDVLPGTVKESTVDNYTWIIEHYVIPYVGRVQLAQLAPPHVHQMLRKLENEGKSPRSRQYARAILRRALGHAERWGMVNRNAAALVEGPRSAGTKLGDALTAKQAEDVLIAAREDRLEALAVVVLRLGLRKGEALGLRWDAVNLEGGSLQVRGTLKRRPGKGLILDDPKTKASNRTLPLPTSCAEALRRRWYVQRGELDLAGISTAEYVFTTPVGTPLDPRNVSRWWDRLCHQAGIGHRRFHATRHTAATLLLDAGVPLEVVSAILGHASLAITADVYAQVTQDNKRRALSQLDYLGGAAGPKP